MSLMEDIFKQLHDNSLVETAEDFSTDWCWRSKSWFAVQKNKNGDFSIPVAINCLNAVKVKIALAHLKRKKLGGIADSDLRILGGVRDLLEAHLLERHSIAAVAEPSASKARC